MDGRTMRLSDFRDRALLVVKPAGKCGFTQQFAGLEELYRSCKDRGFEMLGFSCNQLGGQEPGTGADMDSFCKKN
jgi:glutathione peroxidase